MTPYEIIDPDFKSLVLPNAALLTLGEGFAWLEGPVWFADANQLLVSDLPNDRILRWTEGTGLSVFRQPSGYANGHTRDRQGRLIGCSHQNRCITRTELDGSETVLADRYGGRLLNGPNDVVVQSDGAIWFTDPHYGISTDYEGGKQNPELPARVYRLDPATGELAVVADDFTGRRGWPSLDERWRWRPLRQPQGRSARKDFDRGHGREPRVRRAPSLAPVPLRVARFDGDLHQRPRRSAAMTERTPALRLDRVSLNVGDLAAATSFYTDALGFEATPARDADPVLASLLGVRTVRMVLMRRGRQRLELAACDPPGAAYPAESRCDDLWFQHCALVTDDIGAAHDRLARTHCTPISRHGPQALPGGIVAFKFRDPDGHPIELIQFPRPDPRTQGGIDHSAICVSDPERSIAFYATRLGLAVQARQVNSGSAQESLDNLDGAAVDVISLVPELSAPHVELLGYRTPRGRAAPATLPSDMAACRLVFATAALDRDEDTVMLANGAVLCLTYDPDGHTLLLEDCP